MLKRFFEAQGFRLHISKPVPQICFLCFEEYGYAQCMYAITTYCLKQNKKRETFWSCEVLKFWNKTRETFWSFEVVKFWRFEVLKWAVAELMLGCYPIPNGFCRCGLLPSCLLAGRDKPGRLYGEPGASQPRGRVRYPGWNSSALQSFLKDFQH